MHTNQRWNFYCYACDISTTTLKTNGSASLRFSYFATKYSSSWSRTWLGRHSVRAHCRKFLFIEISTGVFSVCCVCDVLSTNKDEPVVIRHNEQNSERHVSHSSNDHAWAQQSEIHAQTSWTPKKQASTKKSIFWIFGMERWLFIRWTSENVPCTEATQDNSTGFWIELQPLNHSDTIYQPTTRTCLQRCNFPVSQSVHSTSLAIGSTKSFESLPVDQVTSPHSGCSSQRVTTNDNSRRVAQPMGTECTNSLKMKAVVSGVILICVHEFHLFRSLHKLYKYDFDVDPLCNLLSSIRHLGTTWTDGVRTPWPCNQEHDDKVALRFLAWNHVNCSKVSTLHGKALSIDNGVKFPTRVLLIICQHSDLYK